MSSEIPIGAGLGSSAAYSIALSTAIFLGLHIYLGTQGSLDHPQVKSKAQLYADFLERLIHTNPSGVDVAISLNGGMLKFIKGTTPAENMITLLEGRPDGVSSHLEMMLVNTNKARNSKSTIEAVMRLRDSDNSKFTQIMTEIGDTTSRVLEIYQGPYLMEAQAELL